MQTMFRQAFAGDFQSQLSGDAQAAVLIALTSPGDEIIFTRRARHLKSHPGEMAFPGGRRDPGDASLIDTALREAFEEVGLPPDQVEVIGVLPTNSSRFGVPVQPVVAVIPAGVSMVANADELDAIFRIPLALFVETSPTLIHEVEYGGRRFLMPGYPWRDEIVWGLSARFMTRLVERVFGQKVEWPEPVVLG